MTRDQSNNTFWHVLRTKRLTASHFKKICSRKEKFEALVLQLQKKTIQTSAMKRGLIMEAPAAETYSRLFGRNTYEVGFVINPSAFHLGCTPDRRVYDPEADEMYGLLEIKCPNKDHVAECTFLT